MNKKKLLLFAVFIVILVLCFGLIACNNNNVNNEEEPEEEDQPKETQTVNGYLNRINSNLTSEIEYLSNATNYSVESEVEINTSILNYTIQYKASYAGKATNESTFNDSPNNLYYISMFDNKNHKERIKVYYSGKDLYLTFEGKPYVIRDFSSYLLYNLFAQICDYIDLGEIVYGETVRDVFKGGSAIASAVNVNDFKQINTENKGFALSINNIDLGVLMGRINDYIENQTSDIGNIFDAISVYYLGFKLSALMGIKFSSINVDKISFYVGKIQNSTSTTGVEEINTKVSGRLQDASKYSLSVKYAVLEKQSSIEDGVEYIKGVNFASINLKQGTYDGNILLPTLRESDYKITFDYNLDPQNNANNEFTLRIYDKNVSNTTGKYEGINEFLGVYYKNSVLYCNFEGIFNSIGEILQLSALNLPKIYFTDIDISSIMRQIYTYLYRAVLIMLNKDSNTSITVGRKFKEQLYASVTSDISNVKNPKITLELTEELIKAFLNTEKSLALILGEKLGLDEKTIARTIGVSFFSLTRALISYSFGTKFLDIDVYQGDTKVADASMHRDEYVGVEVPTTANDLYYTEFKKQNNYTFNFEINLTPYEKENVDISRIIGAFVGDVSGKNTQLELEPNQYIVLRGKITERQITQMTFNSEDRIIDVGIYIKENNSGEEKLLVHAATSSDNINDALVELGTDLGDYKLFNGETIKYKIPVESIYECLKELGGEDSIYNVNSTTALLVLLTNSLNDKSKTYAQDGYYCASLKIDEDATGKDGSVVDPGYNLFGIEGCNFIIKMKGDFSSIDLTKYKPSTYSSVRIEGKYENGVSYTSIYQNGSAWDTNVKTFIGERTINLYVQYTEESTKIITNKNTYNPTGKLFGKTITYELKILDASGTYVIKDIDLQTINETPTLIIDPALTKTLPTRISVIYDNDDTSEENCEIRGFYETNIQYSGFNKQLLDGDTQNLAKYKLIIGENSIAQVEFDIYIAVIDREIIPVTDNGYIGEIPVIGEFSLDPYYYANRLYYDQDYDYIDEILRDSNLAINFENEYKIYETNGKERIDIDEETEEVIIHRYDREGYNYIYLKNVNTEYDFDKTLITYKGGELYAYGYYGDLEYAIRINVIAKVVDYILINNEESGTYTIDYLITSTYDIPSQTDTNNSVKIVFQDEQKVGIESRKIIRGSRPTEVSSEEFYKNYIISMLDWNGVEEMKSKITLDGTYSLFGDNNETYAYFGEYKISGMEDNFTQKVTVKVNQPSRNIDGNDNVKSIYAVYSYNTPFSVSDPERKNVLINKAKFSLNDSEDYGSFHWMEPFAINPYSEQTYLPETIFLYVQRANSSSYEWKEYNISWATTDRNGNELNIIGINSNNRYYLKAPTVEERYINVYGTVGDGAKVWVNMLLLNMKSEVNDVTLYNQDGTVYNYAELNTETGIVSWKEIKTISIDPYVDYISLLPTRFVVTLGSGEIVSGSTLFYFKNNDITYPVDRSYDNNFASSTYNRNYTSNGRYIFSKSGGNYSLTIFVKGQSDLVSNEISININVLPRLLKKDVDESEQLISNYIDIINIGNLVVGDTYPYVSSDEGGYIDINVYDEESTVIVEKLEEILNNDGIGLVGVVFSNVDNYYVRKASFNLSDLETIINALKHNINNVAYTLRGVIDYDNINSQNIVIKFSLNGQKANSLILTYSRNAIANRVYSIRSDVLGNNDGVLTLDGELNKVTESEFIESNRYNKYFGVTTGYNDADYDYVIYFDVVKAYQLYKDNGTMYYVSPYDYFTYVFSRYDIALGSGRRIKVETDFTGNEKEKFNKAFLGLDATMKEDYFTYAFLTLNNLSRGSVEDKVLLIFKCETSTGAGTNVGVGKNISVDVFDENLKEIYTSNYKLPSKAEITFTSDYTNQTYVVAYETQLWTPVEETKIELNVQGDINAIAYEKIDILSNNGTTYNFTYRLPEINVIYSLGIEFSPKNFNEKLFNADSDNELFTIKEGVINVTNPYMFFKFKENGKYAINEEKIPTVIKPIQTRTLLTVGEVYSYNVEWEFEDVEFDESILTTTQKFKIASYTFDSYKVNGEGKTQTIYLYVDVSEMVFYSFNNKDEKLTIEETEIDGENAIKNVVTIDPYTYKENGRTGTFTLPTSVSIGFKIEKDGKTIEYKNLYENVRYRLLKYDDNTIDFGSIQSFDFTEKGHMLYSGNSSYDVYLRLLIPGFEGDMKLSTTKAIIIKVKIFQRIIEDVNLPNYKYNTDGSYIYTNIKETLSDGREIKVIDSYYPYATVTEKSNVNDDVNVRKVPIYYIDPYNNDTYELPTVVSLKFEGEDDFVDYSISSWKYYNDDSFSESKDNGAFYHPSALEGGNGYYYSYQSGDYKQNVYRLKASIKIGESTQTFEVFCIVINRELKINTLINDSYKTYFDFADPIAALLKDIPSELNEAMFVDYDKYLANIKVDEYISLAINNSCLFSQNGANNAIIPSLLWEDEYDTDGDSIVDKSFNELIKIGFNGDIYGNIYYNSNSLSNEIEYQQMIAMSGFDVYIKAAIWDSFFVNDKVVNDFSAPIINAIETQLKELKKDQIYSTYELLLTTLEREQRATLENSIFTNKLEELNGSRAMAGLPLYDKDIKEDKRDVLFEVYSDLEEEHTNWVNNGSRSTQKTANINIFIEWNKVITEFVMTPEISMYVTMNEVYKAKYIDILKENNAKLAETINEKYAQNKEDIENYIKSTIYENILNNCTDEEYTYLKEIESRIKGTYDKRTKNKLAYDILIVEYYNNKDLGVRGEQTKANITIPIIEFTGKDSIKIDDTHNENGVSINNENGTITFEFSKFDFTSLGAEFKFNFNVTYKEVLKDKVDEAKEEAYIDYIDQYVDEIFEEFIKEEINKGLEEIKPKVINNETGEYEYYNSAIIGNHLENTLVYDNLKSLFNNNELKSNDYLGYFKTLYNNFFTYYQEKSVDVIIKAFNTASISAYEDITIEKIGNISGLNNVYNIIAESLIENDSRYSSVIAAIEGNPENDTAAKRILAIKDYLFENEEHLMLFRQFEGEIKTNLANSIENVLSKVNDTNFRNVLEQYKSQMGIASLSGYFTGYEAAARIAYEGFSAAGKGNILTTLYKFINYYITNSEYLGIVDDVDYNNLNGAYGEPEVRAYVMYAYTKNRYEGNSSDGYYIGEMLGKKVVDLYDLLTYYLYATKDPYDYLIENINDFFLDEDYINALKDSIVITNENVIYAILNEKIEISNDIKSILMEKYKRKMVIDALYDTYYLGQTKESARETYKAKIDECKYLAKADVITPAALCMLNEMESKLAGSSTPYSNYIPRLLKDDDSYNLTNYNINDSIEARIFAKYMKYVKNGNNARSEYIYEKIQQLIEEQITNYYGDIIEKLNAEVGNVNSAYESADFIKAGIYLAKLNKTNIVGSIDDYIDNFGSINDKTGYNTARANIVAQTLMEEANLAGGHLTENEIQDIVNKYLNNYAMRALVYFYDNLATSEEKTIIEIIIEKEAKKNLSTDRYPIEIEIIKQIKSFENISIKNIFNAIKQRDDFNNMEAIEISYNYIFLTSAMDDIYYEIENESASANWYINNTGLYTKYRAMILDLLKAATQKDSIDESEEILFNNESQELGEYIDKLVKIIVSAYYKDRVVNVNNGLYSKTEAEKTELLPSIKKQVVKMLLNDENYSEVFKSIAMKLIDKMIDQNNTEEDFYEVVYNNIRDILVEERTEQFKETILRSIEEMILNDVFNTVSLFKATVEEYKSKMYLILTNGEIYYERDFDSLINKFITEYNRDNIDGSIYESIKNKIRTNDDKNWWDGQEIWWGKQGSSFLDDAEKEVINQLYLQCYYNTNDEIIAKINHILAIARILEERDKFFENGLEKDLVGNELKSNASFIKEIVDGNILGSETLLRAHLKGLKTQKAKEYIEDLQNPNNIIIFVNRLNTYEEYLDGMFTILITNDAIDLNAETGIETKEYLINTYDNILNNLKYTSCNLSKEEAQVDSGLINKYEMIKTYYNNIYQTIIGYGEIIKVETLMWVPLRWYYLEADKKYKAAIEKMGDSEISVKVTFYSEDNIEAGSEESRHILMFDRTTWQEYIEAENNSIPATLNNENIYLSNKEKSEIIERENGTKEYTNTFNMDEVKFALIDINDIKLKFEGEDSLNHITIDALNPVLPSEATGYGKAVGSVGIGEENYSYLLGKVKITEYSEAFYELIYKSYEINTVEEMQAYSVRCRTYTGEIIEVTLSVTYLPREIDSLYTNEDYYSTNAEELGGTIVTGMYSLNDGNKNVVYIDPLVKDTHNDVSFLLPTEIGVRLSDENETEFLFKDVKWSVQPTYTLAGTSGQYVKINITSYTYYDSATLTNRKVDINYSTKVVTITNKKLGEETVKIFKLSDSDKYMLSWNTYIYIEDRTANKVYYNNENNLKVLLGELDSTTKKIDATGSSIRVNPYSPEYPTELTIEFNGSEDVPKDDIVSGATFTLVNSNSLITINQQPYLQGDVNRELNFDAVFKYSGFSIIVTFKAMDIKIPDVEEVDNGDGTTSKQYIQGGTLYLIADQDSANNQVRDFYNHVYYNFGTEEEPNWQKVPLHFETSTLNQISTANPNTYENVRATIGASQSGVLSQNIEFTIKVVNIDALATMESDETGFNKYVEYTYLSVPVDSKNNLRIINGAPNYIGKNFFAYDQNDGSLIEYFVGTYDSTESIATTTAKFNFVDKTVMLPISYKNNKNISNKIAFNSDGDKDVVIQYIMKMNSYVYENVKSVELNSDSTGKKWKWTSVNKGSENYVDALFWPLGVRMNTDDLPTLINTDTGEEIKVYWDLSELNVNKANTQYTYVDGETKLEGGKEITGWYIGNNNIWNSIPLIVYIDKVDIHEQILAKISAELDKTSILSGEYSKEYDGQFVKIEIDLNEFSVIRENGKIEPLEGNDFTITYYEVLNESEYIEIDGYPINAGTYFVRININDYNIECVNDNRYDSLIMIYIDKTTIDLSTFKFEGEELDNNEIELKYDGKQKSISISSGIPLVAVDNWFEPGEKEELFNKYRNVAGATDEIAKSQVYDTIYLRVSEIAQQKLTDWYDLVQRRLNTNNVITIKAGVYDEFMVYNLKIEEAVFSISYKKDGIPTQNLSDCGRYSAEVVFKEGEIGNENYVLINTKTINISIVKNEEIEYRFTSDLVVYNGTYQNPRINGINGEEGSSIPSGVIIKYTYSARDIDEYTVTYDGNYTSTKVSTSGAIITGIKDVGEYYYTVQIIGGNNYIDGVFSGTVRVIPADMYIDINNQTIEYLDDVPTIANQIVVYTSRYPEGDRDKLLENDKLSSLGTVVFTDTGINKNSPVGTYYIKILGLRADGQSVDQTFTKFASADNDKLNPYVNKNSRKIEIKAGSEPGSIALDDREEYKNIIALFNNYNVYVSFIKSDGEDNESAARYTITTKSAIEGQEKVYAVDSNEELIDVLARINSNLDQEPEVSIYLTPLDNGLSYNDITINTNKRVNIIGYYDVIDSSKIATKVNSLNIIKCDMINLNILSINITTSNKTAISVGKMVGNIVIERCNITATTLTSTFGIYTEDYYSGTMTVKQSTISNFDTAIRIHKGFLEVKNCSFYRNITDIKAEDTTTNLIVTNNLFNGSQTAINSGIYTNISIKENTFEYLYIGIQIELTINNDIYLQNTYTEVNIPVKISAD